MVAIEFALAPQDQLDCSAAIGPLVQEPERPVEAGVIKHLAKGTLFFRRILEIRQMLEGVTQLPD